MDSRLLIAFGHWTLLILDFVLVIGIVCFLKLPKQKKTDSAYWFPFLILCYIFTYQNFAAYTNYNFEFKKEVNAYLGNTENPKFNLWLFNIAERQIRTILYLLLVKFWLDIPRKKYINWMILTFVTLALVLQISGVELMYSEQPIIFAFGANMILIACGLYFIGLITNEKYLESNPLRLASFWTTTILLFNFSLSYIYSVSLLYVYRENPTLGKSLSQIPNVMESINFSLLVLLIASPLLPKLFDKEPLHESA
jgi:hypothetical protein